MGARLMDRHPVSARSRSRCLPGIFTRRWALLVTGLSLAACRSDAGTGEPHQARDSAGIRIVENVFVAGDRAPLTLRPDPTLRIGEDPADTFAVFGYISQASWLSDGRIVVSDAVASGLTVFSPDGSFDLRIGRRGDGPGEFRSGMPFRVMRGDTIAVLDDRNEIELFTSDGGAAGTLPWPEGEDGAPLLVVDWYADGGFLTGQGVDSPARGVVVDSVSLAEGRLQGNGMRPLAVVPAVVRNAGAPRGVIFGPQPVVALDDGGFWWALPIRYELVRRDRAGRAVQIVRRLREPTAVTPRQRSAYADDIRDAMAANPPYSELGSRALAEIDVRGFAPTVPVFDRLVVDGATGHLWVRLYGDEPRPELSSSADSDEAPGDWDVFDPSGVWLGTVTLPRRFELMEVRSASILGVYRDELSVPSIRVYETAGVR